MRTNYFLKNVALTVVALFGVVSVFAQGAKAPNFKLVASSVTEETGVATFVPVFEAAAAWGDYNNDGHLDLLTVGVGNGRSATLHKNNGDGTFTIVENPFFATRAAAATWLDFDNDGNLDVFIAGNLGVNEETKQTERISGLFRNLGPDGNYEFEEVFAGVFMYVDNEGKNHANRYVAVADYNNDGYVDIYMQGWGSTRQSRLYRNVSGVDFTTVWAPVNGVKDFIQMNAGEAVWADMNNDGFMDLLVTGYAMKTEDYPELTAGYRGAIYLNNGDGTFAEPYLFDGTCEGGLVVCDFNGDGKLDFAVSGVTNNPSYGSSWRWPNDIYINNGDGKSYTKIAKNENGMSFSQQEQALTYGDVNNDGFPDLLFSKVNLPSPGDDPDNPGTPLPAPPVANVVFLNNGISGEGQVTFSNTIISGKEIAEGKGLMTRAGSVCLVDYNNDNSLDIFVTGYANELPAPTSENPAQKGGAYSALYKNELGNGVSANQPPSMPANLKYTVDSFDDITFTWDAATDDHTPQAALQYNLFVQKASTGEIMSILPAHIGTGRLKVNENLAGLTTTSYTLTGWELEKDDKYGVQAIDGAKVGGKFNIQIVGKENSAPSILQDNINVLVNGKTVTAKAKVAGNVAFFNVSGMNVAQTKVNTPVVLTEGVYIVKVATANGSVVKKVIVK